MYQVLIKAILLLTMKTKFIYFSSFSVTRYNKEYKDELTARQVANDNPFDSYVLKPEPGRGLFKQHPVLVPSMKSSRWEDKIFMSDVSKYSLLQDGWMLLRGWLSGDCLVWAPQGWNTTVRLWELLQTYWLWSSGPEHKAQVRNGFWFWSQFHLLLNLLNIFILHPHRSDDQDCEFVTMWHFCTDRHRNSIL